MVTMKMARVGAGYTMEEIAEKLDISSHTYSKYERYPGTMRIDKAKQFCEIVGVSIDDIFFLPTQV